MKSREDHTYLSNTLHFRFDVTLLTEKRDDKKISADGTVNLSPT